jgi:hypothetical protein
MYRMQIVNFYVLNGKKIKENLHTIYAANISLTKKMTHQIVKPHKLLIK